MSSDPDEASGAAGPRLLGLALCAVGLAVNRWSVGWLLTGGDFPGALPNLLLFAGQATAFCLGTAVLRRPGRVARLGPASAMTLGVLLMGVGVLGAAMTLAPFVTTSRFQAEAEVLERLTHAEARLHVATVQLEALVDDLADGALGADSRGLLAERVLVADAEPWSAAPGAQDDAVADRRAASAVPGRQVERFRAGREVALPAAACTLFRPVLAGRGPLAGARLRWLGGLRDLDASAGGGGAGPGGLAAGSPESAGLRTGGLAEVFGRVRRPDDGRAVRSLRAELEVEWSWTEQGVRISALRVRSAEVRGAARACFEPVFDGELPEGLRLSSLTVIDLDRDGHDDLFATADSGPPRAWVDAGAGQYSERSRELGLGGLGPARDAVRGDFDRDGRTDLLVAGRAGPLLLLAGSDGSWTPRAVGGVELEGLELHSLVAGDLNGDGWLDALGLAETPLDPDQVDWAGTTPRVGVAGVAYVLVNELGAEAGQQASSGAFAPRKLTATVRASSVEGATAAADGAGGPPTELGPLAAASLVDLDADGDLDLCLVPELGRPVVFANDGEGRFEFAAGAFDRPPGERLAGAVGGDHDGDGRADLLALRADDPIGAAARGVLGPPSEEPGAALYWNDGSRYRRVFGDEATVLSRVLGSRGDFVDLDGNGTQDLVVSGATRRGRGTLWWRDALLGRPGERLRDPRLRRAYRASRAEEDQRARPAWEASTAFGFAPLLNLRGSGADGAQPLLVSLEGLDAVADQGGAALVAWLDVDRDGLPDPAVVHRASGGATGDRLRVYANRLGSDGGMARTGLTLAVRLDTTGCRAAGARIEVHAAGRAEPVRRTHDVAARSGGGAPTATLVTLAGPTAAARTARRVVVTWPDGHVQEAFDVPGGTELTFYRELESSPSGAAVQPRPYRPRALVPQAPPP